MLYFCVLFSQSFILLRSYARRMREWGHKRATDWIKKGKRHCGNNNNKNTQQQFGTLLLFMRYPTYGSKMRTKQEKKNRQQQKYTLLPPQVIYFDWFASFSGALKYEILCFISSLIPFRFRGFTMFHFTNVSCSVAHLSIFIDSHVQMRNKIENLFSTSQN